MFVSETIEACMFLIGLNDTTGYRLLLTNVSLCHSVHFNPLLLLEATVVYCHAINPYKQ